MRRFLRVVIDQLACVFVGDAGDFGEGFFLDAEDGFADLLRQVVCRQRQRAAGEGTVGLRYGVVRVQVVVLRGLDFYVGFRRFAHHAAVGVGHCRAGVGIDRVIGFGKSDCCHACFCPFIS